jgi:hypothetical protein
MIPELPEASTSQALTALDRLQRIVALAYGLRNCGAHNTGTAANVWSRFDEVERSLFRVLFATIDHLYEQGWRFVVGTGHH